MIVEAVEHLVRGIVDNPDDVTVSTRSPRRNDRSRSGSGSGGPSIVEVRVHPDDLGKVIGRNGRTAKALRTVVAAIGGRGVRVDLVDETDGRR
ncbi:MAG: uncharacterized protein QOI42_497 [Frankiaceae bacterium]|nr:uncharacterized protein [Frankiaceae bacterium]